MSKSKKGKWVKLNTRDDWGYKTAHLGEIVYSNAGTNGRLEDQPPQLKDGSYMVKWPNGHMEELTFFTRRESSRVSDMGHYYDVTSDIPYATINYNGAVMELPAASLNCKFWVDEKG
jgi:hypothetical protein